MLHSILIEPTCNLIQVRQSRAKGHVMLVSDEQDSTLVSSGNPAAGCAPLRLEHNNLPLKTVRIFQIFALRKTSLLKNTMFTIYMSY